MEFNERLIMEAELDGAVCQLNHTQNGNASTFIRPSPLLITSASRLGLLLLIRAASLPTHSLLVISPYCVKNLSSGGSH